MRAEGEEGGKGHDLDDVNFLNGERLEERETGKYVQETEKPLSSAKIYREEITLLREERVRSVWRWI